MKEFKDAIEDDYFFEMLIDDLPVWGYIGEVREMAILYLFIFIYILTIYTNISIYINFNINIYINYITSITTLLYIGGS